MIQIHVLHNIIPITDDYIEDKETLTSALSATEAQAEVVSNNAGLYFPAIGKSDY